MVESQSRRHQKRNHARQTLPLALQELTKGSLSSPQCSAELSRVQILISIPTSQCRQGSPGTSCSSVPRDVCTIAGCVSESPSPAAHLSPEGLAHLFLSSLEHSASQQETALGERQQQKWTGLCPHATGGRHLKRQVQKADLGAELFQDRG